MKLLAGLALVTLLLSGCGSQSDSASSGGSTPEQAVMTFLTSLEDGDCAAVKDIVVTPSTVDCDEVRSLKGSYADEGINLDDMVLTAGEIAGDSTDVTLVGDADESWSLERIDGSWRVLYDTQE